MKSESGHIKMKATEQTFLWGCLLYNLALAFKCVDEMLECRHLKKATKQHFHVVLFYPVQLGSSFKQSVNEKRESDRSHESY